MKVLSINDTGNYSIFQAQPAEVETENVSTPNLTVISTNIPPMLTLMKGEISHKWVFYAVVTMNNPDLAMDLYEKGQDLMKFQDNGKSNALYQLKM